MKGASGNPAHHHTAASFHGLDDQWNEGEIIVMGDQYPLHKLNGKFVTMATQLGPAAGHVAIEAETGVTFWRNIRIKEFDHDIPVEEFLKTMDSSIPGPFAAFQQNQSG